MREMIEEPVLPHHPEALPPLRRLVGLAVIALLVVAGACGGDDGDDADAGDATTTTTAASDDTTTTAAAPGETTPAPGSGTAPSEPTGPPPTITSFTTPEDIDCHNGNDQSFTASWETTNATKVTISIDGPGVYEEYAATGEASLPFNCAGSHTFLLTAISEDGQTATRSITLEPRNVQPPANAGQDQ